MNLYDNNRIKIINISIFLLIATIVLIFILLKDDDNDPNYYYNYINKLKDDKKNMLDELNKGNKEINRIEKEILK